jgi:hypothetical protein
MATKDNILDDITKYLPRELANFVTKGTISLEELADTGQLTPKLRREIETLISQTASREERDWDETVAKNTISAYQNYLSTYPSGKFVNDARDRLEILFQGQTEADNDAEWESVDKSSIESLQRFVRENPDSPHTTEARAIINDLYKEERRGNGTRLVISAIRDGYNTVRPDIKVPELLKKHIKSKRISSNDIATVIGEDNNVMETEIVQTLCREGILEYADLESTSGIDPIFIDKLMYYQSADIPSPPSVRRLESIQEGYTEVYFWGIPSSGKTCALGAILSALMNGTNVGAMHPDGNCQGAAYMMQLACLFDLNTVSILPPRTDVQDTSEMRFTLVSEDGREHKLAFIDLSGELFTCMHLKASGLPFEYQEQEDAINTLDNILVKNKTNNRKIHFFVVEYGAENKRIRELSQDAYLQAAISYIREMNIFDNLTDGVYMIVTKADKANVKESELGAHLASYIETYYNGLYQGLVDICKKKEINGGKVLRFPFSIGKVCFQNLCKFDKSWTLRIIDEIKYRSYAERAGLLGKLTNIFNK